MGSMFLYAGITKLMNPEWSAGDYLASAKTFKGFYLFLAAPETVGAVSSLNEWALTLLGISLILGIFVRLSSVLGIILMFLYYLPILDFPYVGKSNFIVDQHVIYIFVLLYLAVVRAGRVFGLDPRCARLPLCRRLPRLRGWLG